MLGGSKTFFVLQ